MHSRPDHADHAHTSDAGCCPRGASPTHNEEFVAPSIDKPADIPTRSLGRVPRPEDRARSMENEEDLELSY